MDCSWPANGLPARPEWPARSFRALCPPRRARGRVRPRCLRSEPATDHRSNISIRELLGRQWRRLRPCGCGGRLRLYLGVWRNGVARLSDPGAEQASMAGDTDVFVTKWNAAGTGLMYSTYIGGSNRDVALGVSVYAAGYAYVTGFTYSGDFPITSGALRASFVGDSKAFVIKLNPAGNGLVYSTFLGGSGDDYGAGIAVDAAGEAHIAGYTASVDFPTATGAFQQYYGGGSYDGFLAKLNAAGSALVFATYLGGIGNDTAAGVALDPSGNIYVTGQTQSANFPTLNPLQAT